MSDTISVDRTQCSPYLTATVKWRENASEPDIPSWDCPIEVTGYAVYVGACDGAFQNFTYVGWEPKKGTASCTDDNYYEKSQIFLQAAVDMQFAVVSYCGDPAGAVAVVRSECFDCP